MKNIALVFLYIAPIWLFAQKGITLSGKVSDSTNRPLSHNSTHFSLLTIHK